jgi:acyl transferase domain-containing protein/acyl carrier protein/protein-L-isoaspartate O-methyltransferase
MSDFTERIAKLSPKRLALLAVDLQSRLEVLERARTEPIAIIGLGCRFPGGATDPEAFWRLLDSGRDAITPVPPDRWDVEAHYDPDPDAVGTMSTRFGGFLSEVDRFDAAFFGISPREALTMDPQQRLLLEVSWEALEDAGQGPDQLGGTRTGVFVGLCNSDYYRMVMAGDPRGLDAYVASGGSHSVAAGRLSYALGLQGPSIAVDTACSSSLVAIHLACQSLRSGESRMAVAGGVNLVLGPEVTILLSKARMMAPDGRCKAFDARADGFVRGEGCGIVVLKRLSDAVADGNRVLALIRSTAVNQDGRSNGLTAPNGPAQEAVLREALAAAGVAPGEISYVEAHGTGTALGDPIEIQALGAVLGGERPASEPLVVGSVKTNIGHLEAAAGIAGLIKIVLAMRHGRIPPHLHFQEPNPHIPWSRLPIRVPTEATPWPLRAGRRLAGVSSFGFSGTNAHVVVEGVSEPELVTAGPERPMHLLALSAQGEDALRGVAARLADHLDNIPAPAIADVCFSAAAGRAQHPDRIAAVVSTLDEVRAVARQIAAGERPAGAVAGRAGHAQPAPVFLFTGQGSQYAGMGRELYETQPTFRAALERCDAALRPHLEVPLLAVLYPEPGSTSPIDETAYTQPALFAIEYALCELWRSWGVVPAAVMGHSLGEYVAACVAGVWSVEDGLRLVAERGRLMQGLPAGDMVAVFASEECVAAAIDGNGAQVAIAAVNGPDHVVVSGPRESVAAVTGRLRSQGIQCRPLIVSHAFHSPMMDPILHAFEARAAEITPARPRIRMVSNLTGRMVTGEDLATAAYWRRQLREPVRFADGLRALKAVGHSVFVEIGPTPTLLGMAARCLPEGAAVWLPSLRRGRGDWSCLLESLATLYARGVAVDWTGFDRDYSRRRLSLPAYPFQRTRHWIDAPAQENRRRATPHDDGSGATPDERAEVDRWLYQIAWAPRSRAGSAAWLPAVAPLTESLAASANALRREHGLESYGELLPELDRLCAGYIGEALETLGGPLRPFQRVAVGTLAAQLGVVDRHHRLLGRMLEILEEDGVLRADGSGWTVRSALPTTRVDGDALAPRFPQWRAQVAMTTRCGARLADVLRGACDPLHLLFPDGSLDDAEQLYAESPFARAYNTLVADTVAAAAQACPPGRVLRVLEIGAGTGGTTAAVLRRLAPEATDYVFTDVSPVFTSRAAERFRAYPFVRYEVLDIERDPAGQGLAGERFDVVLAANVLHATADLRRTLRHVRQLLAPEGLLVLVEATSTQRFGDLTVGLTEGWWKFTDSDLRPSYALLPRDRWATLLRSEGFTDVGLVPGEGDESILAHQALVLARGPRAEIQAGPSGGRWLVLADAAGVGDRLCELLEADGESCVLVKAGAESRQVDDRLHLVAADQPEALRGVLESILRADGGVTAGSPSWRGIVNLWSLDGTAETVALDGGLEHVLGSTLVVAQVAATIRPGAGVTPRLWLVTRGAQPAGPAGRLAVAQAPVWGLGAVIALEHPELRCARVDLDPAGADIAALYAELRADDREDQIALRGPSRYVARLQRATPLTRVPHGGDGERSDEVRVRSDSTYLISGGLGGLGLRAARWLVQQGARHLVLIGRRGASAEAREAIRGLESAGARVLVEQVDVARRLDLAGVLERVAAVLPPVRGVLHAAGVLDDGVLVHQGWDRFARVLAPKVLGTANLEALTEQLPLDFFILFSSGASMIGSAGQGNHAAANAYLDAVAHDRRARGRPGISINWGPWAEIGAAAGAELGVRILARGMGAMSPEQGIYALAAILQARPVQIGVLPIAWPSLLEQFGAGKEPPLLADLRGEGAAAIAPGGTQAPPKETALLTRLGQVPPAQRPGVLLSHVVTTVARVLRVGDPDSLDLERPLPELGLDSLMALELRNALSRTAGCPLPATLLFDCPTPTALARALGERLLGESPTASELAPPVAGLLDECSEEELAALLAQKLDEFGGGAR